MDREPAQAAVLMGLVMREEPTVLLTQRTEHMSTHAGQVAFAGGKCDAQDADAAATALREAYEEVGLESHHIQVLGELPTYITGSAFHVTPIVALIDPAMQLQINTTEVAHAFEVPLAYLMNPANHRWHVWEFEGCSANGYRCRIKMGQISDSSGVRRPGCCVTSTDSYKRSRYHRAMSFLALLFAFLIEQVRPLAHDNWAHRALRAWLEWISHTFDAGQEKLAWMTWALAVGVPSVLSLVIHWVCWLGWVGPPQ